MDKISNFILYCLVFVILLCTIVADHGLLRLSHMGNEMDLLETKNREIEREIAAINDEIRTVRHSGPTLEKHLRKTLGLSREDEIVYIFPKENNGAEE